jgi:hypothetical protein
MRALSATLFAAAAATLGAAAPVTLVPAAKPTLNAPPAATVKFVEPPANVSLNARDVPITVGFADVPVGEEVRGLSVVCVGMGLGWGRDWPLIGQKTDRKTLTALPCMY